MKTFGFRFLFFTAMFLVVGISVCCGGLCAHASDDDVDGGARTGGVSESRNLVLGVNFNSSDAQEVSDIEEESVSRAYDVLEKGFKNFAFGVKADANINPARMSFEQLLAQSLVIKN